MEVKFSERIRELRKEAGINQSDLAVRLRTTQRKVSYWESGKIEPSLADLWRISDYFSVSVDYLIGKSEY